MKKKLKIIIAIIIGTAFVSGITYAATTYYASSTVAYDNYVSSLSSDNVQDALDELYVSAGEYTDIFPERPAAIKMSMLIEEMHRLHVNFYKNFKWNDYMYKE